jgi:uncharacterized protein (DUF1330 family)
MAAYLIANIDVTDPAAYEEYRARVPAVIRKHGGEYVVRGGNVEIAEGSWKPSRLVVLRFADMAAAQSFYNDPEYAPLKKLRQRASTGDIVFVEGA